MNEDKIVKEVFEDKEICDLLNNWNQHTAVKKAIKLTIKKTKEEMIKESRECIKSINKCLKVLERCV